MLAVEAAIYRVSERAMRRQRRDKSPPLQSHLEVRWLYATIHPHAKRILK